MRVRGVLPALTTPFEDGKIHTGHLRSNVERYLATGVSGILVLGSTGEAVLLDAGEREDLVTAVREVVPPDHPLIVGVGAESTPGAIEQAAAAGRHGADAVLVLTPHYYRGQMTADALAAHYIAVADASPVPVLLYNVPKFTGLELPAAAVEALAGHGNVVGMKDSSGNLGYLLDVLECVSDEFEVLCGDAAILPAAMAAGAVGAILAAACVFPEPWIRIVRDIDGGAPATGPAALHRPAMRAVRLVAGRYGIPGIKAAMDFRGLQGGPPRAPLQPVYGPAREEIGKVLDDLVREGVLERVAM